MLSMYRRKVGFYQIPRSPNSAFHWAARHVVSWSGNHDDSLRNNLWHNVPNLFFPLNCYIRSRWQIAPLRSRNSHKFSRARWDSWRDIICYHWLCSYIYLWNDRRFFTNLTRWWRTFCGAPTTEICHTYGYALSCGGFVMTEASKTSGW